MRRLLATRATKKTETQMLLEVVRFGCDPHIIVTACYLSKGRNERSEGCTGIKPKKGFKYIYCRNISLSE